MFQNCSSNFESPGASDLSRLAVDELPEGESEVDESAPPVVVIPPADNQNPEIKDEVLSSPPEVMINGDEVKILFRPKFPAQAFIIYGKDNTETNKETDYLNSHIQTITNIEVGVKYQYSIVLESENGTIYQTPQYSFELIANGEELGAPPAPLPEAESVKTPGTVTGMNPPQDSVQAGIWVDFSEIKSKGLSIGHYPDDDHYVAEFLYQNSRVTYWEVDSANKRIRSIAPPEPSNTAITLPKPNGNDDTEDVEKLINSNPGKEFVGQSGNYKIADMKITADNVKIFNLNMVPAKSTSYFIFVTGKNVRVYNSPIDAQNQGSVCGGWEVSADGFHLINSGFKNSRCSGGKSGAGVRIKGAVGDYHLAGNEMYSIVNVSGNSATHRANPFWVSGGIGSDGVRIPAGGGYVVNNVGEIAQSNGTLDDADFLTYQTHGSFKKVLKVFANRYKDAGKRFLKVQSPGVKVLSNHMVWESTSGVIGSERFRRLHFFSIQSGFKNNFVGRNNRIFNNNKRNWSSIFNVNVGNPSQKWEDITFENNYIEINNEPDPTQTYDKYIFILGTLGATHLPDRDHSLEAKNVSIANNYIAGSESPRYNYWFHDGWDKDSGKVNTSGNIFKNQPVIARERRTGR